MIKVVPLYRSFNVISTRINASRCKDVLFILILRNHFNKCTHNLGKDNIRWPGLSAPIVRGREIVQREQLPPDEKYEENLTKMRDNVWKAKKHKIAAIDRGYSGGHAAGRRIGPPDPVGEGTF